MLSIIVRFALSMELCPTWTEMVAGPPRLLHGAMTWPAIRSTVLPDGNVVEDYWDVAFPVTNLEDDRDVEGEEAGP